jgi:hypothetical protein
MYVNVVLFFKREMRQSWAESVYSGLWYVCIYQLLLLDIELQIDKVILIYDQFRHTCLRTVFLSKIIRTGKYGQIFPLHLSDP